MSTIRPFILEHVAQQLNGLDPNFTGVVGLGIPSNAGPGTQLSANRVGIPASAGIFRLGNHVNSLSRVGNSLSASSTLSVISPGLPLRRPPGSC
ncbi:hypothetical protein DCAR_0831928 [Daucus carota subsp. sativus]|uniref:Uncharacterized protein n=1 Tax=Daucus carota subsp. sativus TaxID=79200 RepID=A0A175YQA9_DAUCS|nr:hypothetical protein DCAR_0831928 [Daucus carota subsp. sativus]